MNPLDTEGWEKLRYPNLRHLIILGAGSSLAAFPNGDKNGKKLPLMDNFVETLNIANILKHSSIEYEDQNFEDIYNKLYSDIKYKEVVKEIESKIWNYFSSLVIPDEITMYDKLILSLKHNDMIATFNWDPFLIQTYKRNSHIGNLPQIAFLHGNVAVGICMDCDTNGFYGELCPQCGEFFNQVRLLFPISNKNYKNDPYLNYQWECFDNMLDRAFIITIFGYSAPKTDVNAKELMLKAVSNSSGYQFKQVEFVDIKEKDEIRQNWRGLYFSHHYQCYKSIHESVVYRHPRRSCDNLGLPVFEGEFAPKPVTHDNMSLREFQEFVKPIIEAEIQLSKK